jgi:5-methylthioadenosine/S-adenosylhomocysteine deaminase
MRNADDTPTGPTAVRYIADHAVIDARQSVVSDCVIDVVDDRVTWSGPLHAAPVSTAAVHRLPGLVLPGFVNAHAHTPMVVLRGMGEGLPTDRWLNEVIWPREGRLSAADVAASMRLGAGELLCNGFTTSNEMYFYSEEIADTAAAVGLRCLVSSPLLTSGAFARFGEVDQQLDHVRHLRSVWNDHRLIEVVLGPHAAYTLSEASLLQVADHLAADPTLLHIHVAEQSHEGDGVLARTGLTVPAYLDRLGLLGDRTLAAHGVWLTSDDAALLAERGASVAHCPVSNAHHASGTAPVTDLLRVGVTVGLGTDGPVSHDRLDPFAEMRAAAAAARLRDRAADALTATDVLTMATSGSADALGRPDLGRLTPHARADFIRLDTSSSAFDPVTSPDDLVGRVVWAGHPALVRDVWVAGRHVVADGVCVDVDVPEARREVVARSVALAQA